MPPEVDEQWKRAELIEYLGVSFLSFPTSDITARKIVQNLYAVYERKSLASQLADRKRLLSLQLSNETLW